ncbi:hypothetical protein [Actinomycetospora corticicola]|uniref:Uncharacterized protein n=1 Tax=Actinomycetospora corticicola TaxID=663602 RepID=A0A7Y9E2C3_9PSEU|nr:hypothetical protein [Actinomycetospora corticicola]NYD39839.1 hypothetical protein [Actinomycetospora corticicola]
MTDAADAAISALREATQALGIGQQAASRAEPTDDDEPGVALEVAYLLDATVHLLRSTDLESVPGSSESHRLHAVVQHLSNGAELARRGQVAGGPIAAHPEPRTAGPQL